MYTLDLSINNFYAFLVELSFSVLFLVLFASIHYNLTKSNKFKNLLEKKKWFSFIYFFLFGAFLAMLTFAVSQLISNTIEVQIGLPAVILGLIFAMSFFYSSSIQAGAVIPTVFWVLVQYNGFSNMSTVCWIRLIYVCIFALVSFGTSFIKEKRWLIFIIANIALAGIYLLLLVWMNDPSWVIEIIEAICGILTSLVFFAICKALNNMFSNITSISNKAVYIDKYFLIPSILNEKFNEFVNTNSVQQALVFTLESKDLNNPLLKDAFGQQLRKSLWDQQILYFKTPNDKFGFIIIGNQYYLSNIELSCKGNLFDTRIKQDPISKIESILFKIPKQYFIDGKEYNINVKYYLSVYGIHSYDINELLWFNQFMINNEDVPKSNLIKVFDSNMVNHISNDKISYAALSQQINLNEIDIDLEQVRISGRKDILIYPRFYWVKKLTCDINKIMSSFDKQTANTLLRSLAVRSIELYEKSEFKGKNKLLIQYPIDELTSNFFSTSNIIKKIKLFGIQPKDIIFSFNCKMVTNWPYRVIKNLKEFENKKLSYFLIDVINTNVFKTLKPQMIILDYSVESNKKSFKKAKSLSNKYKQNLLIASAIK